jgi:hypothetical protein
LYKVLGLTMDADPDDPSTWPELLEVEYLPLPNKPLFFQPRKSSTLLYRKKHSQFVLEAFFRHCK